MSQKVDPFNGRKPRRYTKKTHQFGGTEEGSIKYKVTGNGDFVSGLSDFLADNTTPTGTKITKATIPRANSDDLKKQLQKYGYAFKETGSMGCRNCDREITTPLAEKFEGEKYKELALTVGPILSADVEVEIKPDKKKDFEYYASKNKLDVKTSTGISVSGYTIDSDAPIIFSDQDKTSITILENSKITKVTIAKEKKNAFEEAVNQKSYSCKNIDRVSFIGKNTTYELTTPSTVDEVQAEFTTVGIEVGETKYTATVLASVSAIKKLAKGQNWVVKDSNGNKLKLNDDQEYSVVKKGLITTEDMSEIARSTGVGDAVSFGMKVEVPKERSEDEVKNGVRATNNDNKVTKATCKKDGICGISKCDYDVTLYGLNNPPKLPVDDFRLKSVRANFQVSTDEQLRKLKWYISKKPEFELIDSNGKTVKVDDKESKKLIEAYETGNVDIRSKYIISFNPTTEPDYKKLVEIIREILKKKDPNVFVETESGGISVITTVSEADVTTLLEEGGVTYTKIEKQDPTPPSFDDLIKQGLSAKTDGIDENKINYDEKEFEKVFAELIDNNPKMKTDGTLMIKEPTELKDKMVLYTLLMNIKALVRGTQEGLPDAIELQRKEVAAKTASEKEKEETKLLEMEKASLLTQRSYVATFFTSVNELRQTAKGDLTPDALKDTPVGVFFKRLYDVEKPIGWLQGKLNAAARVVPLIAMVRNYSRGVHTISFDSKMIGEEALRQQRQDIARGIENEFAMMSAFVGTKSQKVAGKTAMIAAAFTGLWGLVSQLQKNPETAGLLAGVVAAAGPQALFAAGIFAIVVASYYVYLKIQDKYAKYFNLIRTMNEFMIVLNKIERLVRLSMNISQRYQFNVNLKEIEAQLKILFDRFNKMLSEDDVSQIEQSMKNQTKLPDFGEAAAQAESKAETAATQAMEEEAKRKQAGGGLGDFFFRVTFDVEMWNQKLNDDVVKLNLYFTTAMAEFSMVLNVIQIGLLTGTDIQKNVIKTANEAVTESTEYRKMIIGILLNDILKLKVDYSYCNRGGFLTNTKSEGVCMDPENMEMDSVGNRRSKFKEKLHGLIKYLAEVLTHPNCPYPDEIKYRIKEAVIDPYVRMVNDAKPELGKGNKFYLTDTATLSLEDIQNAKKAAIKELDIDDKKLLRPQQTGGKWRETPPSLERDVSIIQELKSRAYDFVTHEAFMQFLMGVDKFVKAENEPSSTEKKEAAKIANDIVIDAKISAVVTADLKETQQSLDAESAEAAEAKRKAEEEERLKAEAAAAAPSAAEQQAGAGGRRLTRKKRHANKKKVRQTKAVKKSHNYNAKAAVKGKLLKK
jgi:hypothetical protein